MSIKPSTNSLNVNFIRNGTGLQDTSGWTTYADAAGAAPVDGTGGSPNVTWTINTSSPIQTPQDFLFTKDAADRQGQGVSYDFVIDNKYRTKPCTIKFSYSIASGTYSGGTTSTDSDLTCWVYDVTNSFMYQIPAYKLQGAINGTQYSFVSNIQLPSNTSRLRLILHVSTTSTSAFTVQFTDFYFGPTNFISVSGPLVDEISWTPTFTNLGTVTLAYARYSRSGQYLKGRIRFTTGTTAADIAAISLPPGLTVNGSLFSPGNGVVGTYTKSTTSAPLFGNAIVFDPQNGSPFNENIYFGAGESTSANPIIAQNGSTIFGNSQLVYVEFEVPIQGWGSNQTLQSIDSGRDVICRVRLDEGTAQAVPNNTLTKVNMTNIDNDNFGAFDLANDNFVVPEPGFYKFDLTPNWNNNGSGYRQLRLVTGASSFVLQNGPPNASDNTFQNGSFTSGYLTAGITCGAFVLQTSGATLTLVNFRFNITKASSRSQILPDEKLVMKANKTSGSHTSNNSYQTVASWSNVLVDSYGSFNATTGIYTVGTPGDFSVMGAIGFAGSATGVRIVKVRKNSSDSFYGDLESGNVSDNNIVYNGVVENCIAGDQITVQAFQNSGGNLAYATGTNVTTLSIFRIK